MSPAPRGWRSACQSSLRQLLVLVGVVLLSACGHRGPLPEHPPNPLLGKIFRGASGEEVSEAGLLAAMAQAQVVYLGESHDSPYHHEGQLRVLRSLTAAGKSPALGFEVFPVHQTSILMNYVKLPEHSGLSEEGFNADAWLREKLEWTDPDPRWESYGELLRLAREQQLPAFGIDLPRSLRHRISQGGSASLLPAEAQQLRPSGLDNDNYRQLMYEQFKRSHCGYGSEEYLGRLYDNWVARNDVMAATIEAMLEDEMNLPVVVIVGHGHTRYQMGVYERLAAARPGVRQVSLAFQSVYENRDKEEYFTGREFQGVDYSPAYEYIWFTDERTANPDHCEQFLIRKSSQNP